MQTDLFDPQDVTVTPRAGGAMPANVGAVIQRSHRVIRDSLQLAAMVLVIFYLLLGLVYVVLVPGSAAILTPAAVVTALLLLGLHWMLVHREGWEGDLAPIIVGSAGLVLLNTLLYLVLVRDPLQTLNLVFLLLGMSFMLISTRWLVGLVALILVSWGGVALSPVGDTTWVPFGLVLLSASALSLMLHLARLRNLRHIAAIEHEAQNQALMAQDRIQKLEALMDLSHMISSSLDLDELLNHLVEPLRQRLDCDHAGIFLLESMTNDLVLRAATGDAGRQMLVMKLHRPVDEAGSLGWALQHREMVHITDVRTDPRHVHLDPLPDVGTELVLPLVMGERGFGVLYLRRFTPSAYQESEVRLCAAVADQLATAIQNASRYELERSRRLLTEHLYTVGRALSQTLEAPKVLDLILDSLSQIVSYDRGSVLLERGDVVEIVAARGFPSDANPLEIRVEITEDDVYRRISHAKAPLALPEIQDSDNWKYVENLPRAQSWVGLPLIDAHDEVIGMLSLARETSHPYSEDEIALGTAFAGQAAVALQNARLYMELEEAYQQLERLDRAKSDFISLASHELRTPLTVMIGYTHMLLREPLLQQDESMQMMIEGLDAGVSRLHEVVDRMMDVAEIESQNLQLHVLPISLYDLLSELSWTFTDVLEQRDLALALEDLSSLPEIEGDHVALYKVFYHLIVNAIKYTPDGGEIRISGTSITLRRRSNQVAGVDITIADTGIGIDPLYHDRVFDKFFQTGEVTLHTSSDVKFKGGGPGLGLAIVKGIVEAHNGDVWIQSPGHDVETCPGSTFHVLLPLRQERTGVSEAKA